MDTQRTPRTLRSAYSMLDVILGRLQLTLFVICLCLHNEAVRSQSPLDEKGIHITHNIGRDAVLSCQVRDLGKRKVIWSKLSDPYPISVGTTRFTPSRKYRIDAPDEKTYVLTVKNVDIGDAGEYQCRVSGQVFIADTITLNIQAAQGNTYLIPTETEISAEMGSDVILPCHVENLNDKLVLWKNSQNDVLSLRKKIFIGDRRLNVLHNTRPEWSLEIKGIEKSDYGVYTCVVNSDPVLTRTVILRNPAPVEMAPLLLKDTNFRKKVKVDVGDTVTLVCNFRANPAAKVTWYRRKMVNGRREKEEVGTGNEYTMQSVSLEQDAHYICEGENGLKPSGRGKTRLIVNAPPTTIPTTTEATTFVPTGPVAPRLYHLEERTGQYRGMNVEIKCTAIGQPRPNIHWQRHGHRIADNHKYKVETEMSGRHTFHSVLLVRSLSSRDYGDYECVGYNQLGLLTIKFEIYEKT